MNEEFVPYTEALVLKELGFNELCIAFYSAYPNENNKLLWSTLEFIKNSHGPKTVTAPLYQQVFKWFRKKYKLDSYSKQLDLKGRFYWKITKIETKDKIKGYSGFTNTYEEAELECLRKLIEIVKNNE